MTDHYTNTAEQLRRNERRLRILSRVRPNILAIPFYKMLSPGDRRGIVKVPGIGRLYIDPISYLGRSILRQGIFEPETLALFQRHVKPGDTVFDIGANEGVMSSCAAGLVGPSGCVVAVEPQRRLLDILEINLALNSSGKYHIVHGAISDRDGDKVSISMYPMSMTHHVSIIRHYRWGGKPEEVSTFTVPGIAKSLGIDRINLVKVDVEGYEPEVVRGMYPLLESRRIDTMLIEYHAPILKARGIDPKDIHEGIVSRGYKALVGSVLELGAIGHVFYGQ